MVMVLALPCDLGLGMLVLDLERYPSYNKNQFIKMRERVLYCSGSYGWVPKISVHAWTSQQSEARPLGRWPNVMIQASFNFSLTPSLRYWHVHGHEIPYDHLMVMD